MIRQRRDIFATAEAIIAVLRRHRYALLLTSLLIMMLSTPGVHVLGGRFYPGLARLVMTALFVIVVLSATVTACNSRATAMVTLWLAVPSVLFHALNLLVEFSAAYVLGDIFDILFLSFTVGIGLRFLFRADRVSHSTIWASLCVYLLLGIVWADVYSLLDYLNPESFAFPAAPEERVGQMELGAVKSVVPLYYSFVTMTTLGFGDIVPRTPTARLLTALHAVMGQLYLAVLVARLVGLHISQSARAGEIPDRPKAEDR